MNEYNNELYVARAFIATSSDGEDGFKTFDIGGIFVEIFTRDRFEKALKITHYRKSQQKPPIQHIFSSTFNFCSNDSIEIVKFFANDDVVEW